VSVHRIAAAAGDRTFHRPQGAAVFTGHRHGIHVLRPAAAERCATLRGDPGGGVIGRPRLGGIPSGIGADRAACIGRPLRLRAVRFSQACLIVLIGAVISSVPSSIMVVAQDLMPHLIGIISVVFFGVAFGIGAVGAAVLGKVAALSVVAFVYQVCAFLPAIGL